MLTDEPEIGVIEVSIFSRGYGESIVIHTGDGRWIIIDSHLNDNREPVAISYLKDIGVDVQEAVKAILLTHWHDDHIGGAALAVTACPNAVVALSGFLQRDEFASFLEDRGAPDAGTFGSGIEELEKVLTVMAETGQARKWCWAEKTILANHSDPQYRLEALSPSEADFEDFIAGIAATAAGVGRLGAPKRNDSSVAAVLQANNEFLIFGADLENGRTGSGWVAVHQAVWQSRGRASFYKIAHHGSAGAHYEPLWLDMLTTDVMAALTPWNRGSKLPTQADVDRILERTGTAFAAATPKTIKRPNRLNAVERSLRESKIKIVPADVSQGHVRFRKSAGSPWQVEIRGAGCHLSQILAA